jgi:hypothetical protein
LSFRLVRNPSDSLIAGYGLLKLAYYEFLEMLSLLCKVDSHEKYLLKDSGQAGMTESENFRTGIPEMPATLANRNIAVKRSSTNAQA